VSDAVRLTLALAQASTAVEFRELVRRHPEWRSDDFRLDLLMGIESLRAHAQQREAAIRLERLLALLDDCRAWGIEETLASEFENSLAAALPPELAQHLGSLRHSPAVDTGAWDKFLAGPDVARCPPELRNELRNAMGAHHLKRYRATRDAKAEVSGSVLVVADPTEPDCPLPNAAREANAVAASFSSALILSGAQATRTRVLDELARRDILHFACHGRADLLNPLDSGLALTGGERLTLDDVLLAALTSASPCSVPVKPPCREPGSPRRTGRSVCLDDHNWVGSNRSEPAIHANFN